MTLWRFASRGNEKEWHDWYAWHPVSTERRIVWLERVWRRLYEVNDEVDLWEYRDSLTVRITEQE